MLINIELAKINNDEHERGEILQEAREGIERIKQIIFLLLTLCNPEVDGLKLQKEPTDISGFFVEAMKRYSTDEKIFSTNTLFEPIIIHIDPSRIERVITNLIENATKFGRFAMIELDMDENFVIITVSDRGKGLPKDKESIFKMFKRGENAEGIKGSGIGLASCKAVVEAHEGSITCENMYYKTNGKVKGAKFIVRLPFPNKATKHTLPSPGAL